MGNQKLAGKRIKRKMNVTIFRKRTGLHGIASTLQHDVGASTYTKSPAMIMGKTGATSKSDRTHIEKVDNFYTSCILHIE